ncbi:MAG: VPLPA-CTERM-specific exosortase XrtD [Parvularculaceae bacterium]|nr:VPLPA-CTERM-specific exosortase XrtD [Parvularculaceae bacterium]
MNAISLKLGGRSVTLKPLHAALGLAIVALVFLWRDAFADLWKRWGEQQELSHSYFIPMISAWLVWQNREIVRKSVGAPSWIGAALIGVALAMLLVGQLTFAFIIQQVAIVVVIAGLVAAFGGLSLLRTTLVPILFLFAAVPPPHWLINVLSWKFQEWSSVLGVGVVKLAGVPVFLQGNIIDLGEHQLMVAEACSGLRYLFPFLCLGVMAAYMYRGPMWHKAVITLMTIPITIAMNSVRIAFTAIMVHFFGIEQAQGFTHFFEGWVVFLLCLAALYLVVFGLTRLLKPRISAVQALIQPELPATTPSKGAKSVAPILGAMAVSAGLFLVVAKSVNIGALIVPERKEFAQVVDEFAGWRFEVRPIEPEVMEVLAADDSIVADLMSPQGEPYNIYMAYLHSRRDGRSSWHSPRQCIPGGGWQIVSQTFQKATFGAKTINYNRLVIAKGKSRQLVYYWYDQRGRRIANEFVQKFWLVVDSVIKKRTDGAMVRLIVPVTDGESLEEADRTLLQFMDKVQAFLPAYVPE